MNEKNRYSSINEYNHVPAHITHSRPGPAVHGGPLPPLILERIEKNEVYRK